ncbi:DUF2845 domain-containing protein [Aquisalimonas lutea]|uniref:DUF2845 domain-containing protein n=1 Tax=Aquisalimonas lutea TaxID=1327750 RepID=UPI0025B2965E|nr:DUF2845 domain-containing protein [Aquisalimonas lutea]MDN3518869.1 DUF2845 domain-containing protein [Aquisalimonas lutea]
MKRLIAVAPLLLASLPASADSMRCGNALILPGDHVTEVHEVCGEPVQTTEIENRFGARVGTREVYETGYGRPRHSVTYEDDRVVAIERIR